MSETLTIAMSEVERGDLLTPEGAVVVGSYPQTFPSNAEPLLHRLVVATVATDGDVVVGEQLSNIDRLATEKVTVIRGLPTIKSPGQS